MDTNKIIKNILKGIRVELDDEFDRNFDREAFFDRPWAPHSPNYHPTSGTLLTRTSALRKSLFPGKINGNALSYASSKPYAALPYLIFPIQVI